jgi:ubiquinone/menaquinone biosynthesis C-methylase UbiE
MDPVRRASRGQLGTMTAMPRLDQELYLDFVEGLRKFTIGTITPVLAQQVRGSVAAGTPLPEVCDAVNKIPLATTRNTLLTATQEMNWRTVVEAYEPCRDEFERKLAAAETEGPGRLELDPDFELPEYYSAVEYHLQPGSYQADPIGGYVYHYGTKVFHLGSNDRDEVKIARALELPEPTDGQVRTVVDIGCSIGQVTCAMAERWPDAEAWGIDLAAPLLRYGHARAVEAGCRVIFSQQDARSLRFDDASVDLVYMGTLLHEMPVEAGRDALREARRILRPGGVFVLHDMLQPTDPIDAWASYDRDFDTRFNGERYAYQFVHSGVDSAVRDLFGTVESTSDRTTTWTCVV